VARVRAETACKGGKWETKTEKKKLEKRTKEKGNNRKNQKVLIPLR